MNRRGFLKTATFSAPISAIKMWPSGDQRLRKYYGCITVEGHRAHKELTGKSLHVFYRGKDITHNCYEANDVEGYALVHCRDEQNHTDWSAHGHLHVKRDNVSGPACWMRLTGDILIVPGE